ncbi:MAG: vitamin B12 dependent methionine synthase [Clostridiales bacterium]|nr:vitamin B12 dependent methionine synthase [Clostridiales bacterium]
MDLMLLDTIEFRINIDELLKNLRIDSDSEDKARVLELAENAENIGKPKVIYKESIIDFKGNDYIVTGGIKFSSHIMRVNLDKTDRIFPYVCTCGRELYQWSKDLEDMMEQYWADVIMELALKSAVASFENHMTACFDTEATSNMNPGSLEDWPISQQKELFTLLGDPYKDIGVELTDSYLMLPVKSISGIRFTSEEDFVNCRLCPRERCSNRRVEYDNSIYNEIYK